MKKRKWIVIAYIWCVTILTVFLFPFEKIEYRKENSAFGTTYNYNFHKFIGIDRLSEYTKDGNKYVVRYTPLPLNHAGKLLLITAVFGTVLIAIKPKSKKL